MNSRLTKQNIGSIPTTKTNMTSEPEQCGSLDCQQCNRRACDQGLIRKDKLYNIVPDNLREHVYVIYWNNISIDLTKTLDFVFS